MEMGGSTPTTGTNFRSNFLTMKTLIIHPKDKSTAFLNIVYKNIPEATVITGGVSIKRLKQMIDAHDRVMMMGHESPYGLFSVGKFKAGWYIIDQRMVDALKTKTNSIYI